MVQRRVTKIVNVHQGSAQPKTWWEGIDANKKSEANGLFPLCEDFLFADDPPYHVLGLLPTGEHLPKIWWRYSTTGT